VHTAPLFWALPLEERLTMLPFLLSFLDYDASEEVYSRWGALAAVRKKRQGCRAGSSSGTRHHLGHADKDAARLYVYIHGKEGKCCAHQLHSGAVLSSDEGGAGCLNSSMCLCSPPTHPNP
jgi:hypothetical protein